jgi:hypothetical protein
MKIATNHTTSGTVVLQELSKGEHDQEVPYATLSHRWAPGFQEQLLESTLQGLRHGIALVRLKRSVQDAVHVARHFGINYIWVDTLCILQD